MLSRRMRRGLVTLVGSIALHALAVAIGPLAHAHDPAENAAKQANETPAATTDNWAGDTAELPGGGGAERLVDVEPPAQAAPVAPQPQVIAPPKVEAPVKVEPPKAAKDEAPSEPPAPPPPKPRKKPKPAPSVEASADAPPAEDAPKPKRSRPPSAPVASASAGASAGNGPGGEGRGEGKFGAEGVAGVRDLGRAFTRAIPPACQADEAWGKLAAGDAGKLEIAIHVGDDGKITTFEPMGDDKHPPAHLLALVRRTVALLGGGTFGLRGTSLGAGVEVLELKAITSDGAPATDEGGASSLGYTFDSGRGTAQFTQPNGRHVEIRVRVVK
jgi:outer membrane biosynthesis protein TonB